MIVILHCLFLGSRYIFIEMGIRLSNLVVLWAEFLQLRELVNEKVNRFRMSLKISLRVTSALLILEVLYFRFKN